MPKRTQHRDESVRVLDLISADGLTVWLQDHNFVNCELVGPAVLLFTGDDVSIDSCKIEVSQFWDIDTGRRYSGAVGLRRCRLHSCSFRDVGIAAPAEVLDKFGNWRPQV